MDITLKGMSCAVCAKKIENDVSKMTNINSVNIDVVQEKMTIKGKDLDHQTLEEIEDIVLSYEPDVKVILPEKAHDHHGHDHHHDHDHGDPLLALSISIALTGIALLIGKDTVYFPYIIAVAYIIVGWPILKQAVVRISKGDAMDENFLMSIATIGAFFIGEYLEAVAVMIFYTAGEYLEHKAVDRSRESLKSLLELQVDTTEVLVDGSWQTMDAEEVPVESTILVRPGDKVPLDGVIVEGTSYINMAALTGESVPVSVHPGDEVLAGGVNQDGALEVKTTTGYDDSAVAKILNMVQNAVQGKAKTERFVTRFAKVFTPIVVALAVIIGLIVPLVLQQPIRPWLYRALVFLVISCPCALVLSIPLAYFAAIGSASKQGVLVKGGEYFDLLTKVDTFVFDKTGTLTTGEFKVKQLIPIGETTEEELLTIAAHGEMGSSHPLAEAILNYYEENLEKDRVKNHEAIPGKGVSFELDGKHYALGNKALLESYGHECPITHGEETGVHVMDGERLIGYIELEDTIREDTAATIHRLKQGGYRTVLLSGDQKEKVASLARAVGIDDYQGALLPEDKVSEIERLQSQGKQVCFVGDGINDSPAMAQSDVGLAMGSIGSAAAIEVADMVLMKDKIGQVIEAVKLSERTLSIVRSNVVFILFIKILFMLLGALGYANIWMAVFADVGVAVLAVLNSSRLLRYKP